MGSVSSNIFISTLGKKCHALLPNKGVLFDSPHLVRFLVCRNQLDTLYFCLFWKENPKYYSHLSNSWLSLMDSWYGLLVVIDVNHWRVILYIDVNPY
jgi:hypothetical protein